MAELNKTCQKQFRLEQELAFHKIDAKFEPLGQLMEVDEVSQSFLKKVVVRVYLFQLT